MYGMGGGMHMHVCVHVCKCERASPSPSHSTQMIKTRLRNRLSNQKYQLRDQILNAGYVEIFKQINCTKFSFGWWIFQGSPSESLNP